MTKEEKDYLRSSSTISDKEFVDAIDELLRDTGMWVMVADLAAYFSIHPNRIRSKLGRTNKRELTEGCTCGCRGDITLTVKGNGLVRTVIHV